MATQYIETVDPSTAQTITDILTALKNRTGGTNNTPLVYNNDTGELTYFDRVNGIPRVLLASPSGGLAVSQLNDREMICEVVAIAGAALHAANLTLWTAPAAAMILRVVLDITTASSGASTIDIGYTATGATTSSDTLLDGVSGTPAAVFDSMDPALDSGANAHAQKAASGKWITADEASGDTTGMVANIYIFYVLI